MSFVWTTKYTHANAPDANYPQGSPKNVTTPGDTDGTPLEIDWVKDMIGYQQKMLVIANITPSGSPDTVLASDHFDALMRIVPVKVDTLAALKLFNVSEDMPDEMMLTLLGCVNPEDGGGGIFYWNELSTATPDDFLIVKVTSVALGRWIRVTTHTEYPFVGNGAQISSTSFSIPEDLTSVFTVDRRLKLSDSGVKFATVKSSSFGGGLTTVVVVSDSTGLTGALNNVRVHRNAKELTDWGLNRTLGGVAEGNIIMPEVGGSDPEVIDVILDDKWDWTDKDVEMTTQFDFREGALSMFDSLIFNLSDGVSSLTLARSYSSSAPDTIDPTWPAARRKGKLPFLGQLVINEYRVFQHNFSNSSSGESWAFVLEIIVVAGVLTLRLTRTGSTSNWGSDIYVNYKAFYKMITKDTY